MKHTVCPISQEFLYSEYTYQYLPVWAASHIENNKIDETWQKGDDNMLVGNYVEMNIVLMYFLCNNN